MHARLKPGAPGDERDNGYFDGAEVLQKRDVGVDRENSVEPARRELEQDTVLCARPPHFGHGPGFMFTQLVLQLAGRALIEQVSCGGA